MKRSFPLLAATLALLLTGTGVRADPSPVNTVAWTYNFTPNVTTILADGQDPHHATGGLTLTNQPQTSAIGTSDVVLTNLQTFSTALPTAPNTISGSNGVWSIGLALTDNSSSGANSTTMTFSGQFAGAFSTGNSVITSTFSSPTTQTWTAPNGDVFSVSIIQPISPPGVPSDPHTGAISALVTVTPGTGGIHITSVPEPSTLLLSCLGVSLAGLRSWRKRRQAVVA